MATVQIIVPKFDSKSGRPKMVILGSNNDTFEVPWAPREVSHTNMGEDVTEIERPGRFPELAVKAPKLHKMSFSLTLGRSLDVSCEWDVARLEAIVYVGGWIQILYGTKESGLWKCTGFSYSSIEREPIQNQISRCTVDFEFTAIPDSRMTVGKYSNDFNFRDDAVTASISESLVHLAMNNRARTNVATNGRAINSTGNATTATTTTAPHVVQSGETLLSIAQKYYGQYGEQFWRLIGDYNKVEDSLNIGQVLRIP